MRRIRLEQLIPPRQEKSSRLGPFDREMTERLFGA
jgi:hypothetical protein